MAKGKKQGREQGREKPGRSSKQLDLNRCSVNELQRVEGLDRKTAQAIIDHRDRMQGFSDWQDLRKVPGVDETMVNRLQGQMSLGKSR